MGTFMWNGCPKARIKSGRLSDGLSLICPSFGCEVFDLPVGGVRQAGEDVVQIGVRIESATAAALDDGVEDGAAFPSFGFADKQPVFLTEGRWPDGVFDQVVVDLDASIVEVNTQLGPVI